MSHPIKDLYLAHQLDAAWLIALWIAIHDGDPPPQDLVTVNERTAERFAAATTQLARDLGLQHVAALTDTAFQERVQAVTGVEVTLPEAGPQAQELRMNEPGPQRGTRQYCFRFQGKTICVEVPSVKAPPPE